MRVDVLAPAASRSAGASRLRGSIEYHPRYERFLRRCGIETAADALALGGVVVSGHPDRHVARVELGGRAAFLKREHVVGARTRLRNWLAGFGRVSRSAREAATLDRLERAGLPGPQWLAFGEDAAGRAFLLVDELAGATELRDTALSPDDRRELAERAGRAVADLHDAGFGTPELAAKHLFVHPSSLAVTLVDWQNAPPPGAVPDRDRVRQLAGLHASLADDAATPRERLRFAWAYRRVLRHKPRFTAFVRAILAEANRVAGRSSRRDQRTTRPGPRWVWLAGEEVCATPEVADIWPTPAAGEPFYADADDPAEEWVTFPDGRRALVVRFDTFDPVGRFVAALREKPWRSPAAHAMRAFVHLDRHGVPAPRLLAFGQRLTSPTAAKSFVLYEPTPGAVPVAVRLAQLPTSLAARRGILRECGATLRRLHDAGCRLAPGRGPALVAADAVSVEPFAVRLVRRLPESARRADLRMAFRTELACLGRADRLRVARGYGADFAVRVT